MMKTAPKLIFSTLLSCLALAACDKLQNQAQTLEKIAQKSPVYMYLGGIILPAEHYPPAAPETLKSAKICGYQKPDKKAGQICARFDDLYARQYDHDHAGIDVWSAQND